MPQDAMAAGLWSSAGRRSGAPGHGSRGNLQISQVKPLLCKGSGLHQGRPPPEKPNEQSMGCFKEPPRGGVCA